jgi:hypothetical protein
MSPSFRSSSLALCLVLAGSFAACSPTTSSTSPAPPTGSTPSGSSAERADLPTDIRAIVAKVDAELKAAWSAAGVTPGPAAAGATFLRRATLDLTGRLPSPETVSAASSDAAPTDADKSALLVELTRSTDWARHWTHYFDDLWMLDQRLPVVDRIAFRQWLFGEMKRGTSYDTIVREILTASGVNSEGGRPDPGGWELTEASAPPKEVNGAVNWFLQGVRTPQNLAGLASRTFLGVQIQCAECHDHPTESWKQADFRSFTSAFVRVDGRRLDRGRVMGLRRIEVKDAEGLTRRIRRRMRRVGYGQEPPTALDGTALEGPSPRQALARWVTAPDNPWFAKAIVNRLWGQFLGHGFVEPVDDFREGQAVLAPKVLDLLARDFVEQGYDLRRLMRVILSTDAYARAASAGPAATQAPAELWERFTLRPMSDTQLLDALVDATGLGPVLQEVAGERLPRLKLRLRRRFRFTFAVDEETTEDGFTGTVPQALMLLNGRITTAGASAIVGTTVGRAARLEGGSPAAIDALYRATLSREPTAAERDHWLAFVAGYEGSDPVRPKGGGAVGRVYRRRRLRDAVPEDAAYEDIMWALLNSSEFYFIH